ncbi:MAG: calcium/sodium antiporter [Rhodospirillales bacterium]|nr:calcium/sodium antiporter [Rhodospirillales bacterium]
MMYVQVLGGFILLLGGAEIMVRGAVGLSERLGISKMVIGMTVVAFGTSAPELLVSLNAALAGASGIAVGNVVGSNIANILLVLGAAGLIMPMQNEPRALRKDGYVLLFGTAIFIALAWRGVIDLPNAIALLLVFGAFIFFSYWREKNDRDVSFAAEVDEFEAVPHNLWLALIFLTIGFAGLGVGSELLVDGGVAIAMSFGISEAVIGLTIIALGTSLPELAASVVAAYRKHTDVAIGNVVGSNLFNIVGIMGIVGAVTPLEIPARVLNFDMWVMLLATVVLMPYMIGGRGTLGRIESLLFILLYVAYIVAISFGVDRIIPA